MSYGIVTFIVPGEPVTQGGMTAFVVGNKARVAHKNPKGLGRYRADAREAAERAGAVLIVDGPVTAEFVFYLPRPKAHFGTGKNAGVLKDSAPLFHSGSRGDWDKYGRSISDALTGTCWKDDGQLAQVMVIKRFCAPGESPRTEVRYQAAEWMDG